MRRLTTLRIGLVAMMLSAPVVAQGEAWKALEELRDRLEETPRRARFEQTFYPSGFKTGETETGELRFALPGAVRWDYEEPFPKSFLVRGREIFEWSPEEDSGRRFQIGDGATEHLALLRLDVDELRARYDATTELESGGTLRVRLDPRTADTELAGAMLVLGSDSLLQGIEWADREGNRTVFLLTAIEPAEAASDLSPPEGIEWIDG